MSSLEETGPHPCAVCSWSSSPEMWLFQLWKWRHQSGANTRLFLFLWPFYWRVTSLYSTGLSSLLSSSDCWNFHCSLMFQPVNTHIFRLSWGSSFGRAFLWRSLELIILYFILLYKQHSLAKEHNHKKKPLGEGLGGLKKKELFHVQSSVEVIFHCLFSFLLSHRITFTWLPSSCVLPLTIPAPQWDISLAHEW